MQTEGDCDQSDLEREAAIAEAKLIEQEMLKEMKEQEEREQQQRDENGNYCPLQDEYFRDEGDIRIKGLVESLDQGAKRTFDKLNSDEADKMLENVTVEFTINRHYFCKWKRKVIGDEEVKEEEVNTEKVKPNNFGRTTVITIATKENIKDAIEQEIKLLQFGSCSYKRITDVTQQAHYREPIKNIISQLGQEHIFSKNQKENKSLNINQSSVISSAAEQYLKASEEIEQKETKKVKKHKGFMFGGSSTLGKARCIR